jgi:DNA mismatch repair protein MutS
MQQYMQVKNDYPDAIVLFRMGDFYETFFDDALIVSEVLNIALTKRGQGESRANLAGFPYHALDKFIGKLVNSGHKVAICEQIEDPKEAKGIVKRDVTRVITPGTVIEDFILDEKANNYIASLFCDGEQYGLAVCDISTGAFIIGEFEGRDSIQTELGRFAPKEMIIPKGFSLDWLEEFTKRNNIYRADIATHHFFIDAARKAVEEQLGKQGKDDELAVCAAGGLLAYLKENQRGELSGIVTLSRFEQEDYMVIDGATLRNLEVLKNIRDQTASGTLLGVLDKTKTSIGGRMLRSWLQRPLSDISSIQKRHKAVETLIEDAVLLDDMREALGSVKDIERLATKISYRTANARDINTLRLTLEVLPKLTTLCNGSGNVLLKSLGAFPDFTELTEAMHKTIADDPPLTVREGGMIKQGVHKELDELRAIKRDAKEFMAKLEENEIQQTGITSLKIKYNRTFGYFFEVSNRFKDKVPNHYIRKQTLTNGERFITDELKTYEDKILGADDKIKTIEYDILMALIEKMQKRIQEMQHAATKVATLDVLGAFATAAKDNRYTKPEFSTNNRLSLKESRHPVLEQIEPSFIANDCHLDDKGFFMVITGPNMAGKSTYMRQVALCALMAQAGSFVPAKKAKLSIIDRIFTRVGAHDDLTQGQSTFMVEMSEAAHILKNATTKSLIILDEIGRGTSTYDGTAIAWAVAEDIIKRIRAKTLFATHYHVLTQLADHPGAFNMNVAVEEKEHDITFLHRIVSGGTDKSYGIHVGKLAGLPAHVIEEAQKIQMKLEGEDVMRSRITVEKVQEDKKQVTFSMNKQKSLGEY